jgi:hypothetical protein
MMNGISQQESRTGRRWWLPSVSVAVWLAFFLALSLSNWRLVLISADGDPCLHWRIGKWMIEHGEVIRADQFSHTRFGAPLISKEWLSEIAFAAAGNALGWNGIVLLSAALIATTMWLLHRQLSSEGNEVLLSTGLVMLAAFACSTHWLARPHLVTQLLAVVFAWQLHRFDRGFTTRTRLFALLMPLMALWVNLHGAFFVGFVLIGIYVAGSVADSVVGDSERRSSARGKLVAFASLMAGCLSVSLVNPNGWKLHLQILRFLRAPLLASLTDEFRSPNFHSSGMTGFLLVLLVLALMLLVARPRLRLTEILLIGGWGYLALRSARNIPIFALVVTPILAVRLNEFLPQVGSSRWTRLYRRISTDISTLDRSASGQIPVILAAGLLIAAVALPVALNSQPLVNTEILTNSFPVAAVEHCLKSADASTVLRGEMFNDYAWGGYLMLCLPERKVFIDGRNDFYGEKLVEEFNLVDDLKPGWEDVFKKYNVGWTILPTKHPLNAVLALRNDWRLVYGDEVATVHARIAQ